MKRYLAVLATVATIALVVIAASYVWQVRQASTSCESLRDKNRAQLDGGDRKRLNNCIDYNRRSVTPLKLNLFGDLPD